MTIDKNAAPYFDDTQASNNHKQVLFAAGRPVQARELNEVQSNFINQVESLAGHVFENGSRVSNGAVSIVRYEYVRLASLTPDTLKDVDVDQIKTVHKLVGLTSGVEANFVYGINEENGDPATLYVIYTKTGIDAAQVRFVPGEILSVHDEYDNEVYQVMVKCPTCPGYEDAQDTIAPCDMGGKFLSVADGVFYYNGFFVNVSKDMILFSKYGEDNTCKIGFDVIEKIITAEDNPTLYDNALGYPNETAPGADRLQVKFELVKREIDIADGTRFIELAKIEDGYIQTLKSDFEYSDIMDTMAKRTFEESGNYTVSAWKARYREHKKSSPEDANGFKIDGEESLLNCIISKGIGYVAGYRIETAYESFINIPKARDTAKINNGSLFFKEGCYVDLVPDSTMSVWANDPTSDSIVTLKEVQLYDGLPIANAPSGKVIGAIRIADATYVGKNTAGEDVWRYKVISSKLNGLASAVKCVSNETARFLAVPADTTFTLRNSSEKDLFFPLPKTNIKSLRDNDNSDNGSITIAMRKKMNATLDATGSYQFTISSATYDSNISNTIIIVGSAGNYVSIPATASNCIPNGNTLQIVLGSGQSGKNLTVIHTVTNIDLIEKTKQSQTHIITGVTRINTDNFKNRIPLSRADVYKIEYVEAYASTAPTTREDVTDLFVLDKGVTSYSYDESSIKMKDGVAISNAFDTIDIKIRYFAHSDTNSSGYFTIDSYNPVINDEDSGITYKNLPAYATSSGSIYSANQIIDFRTISFGLDVSGEVPATKSTAVFDVEYYVGRRDLLCVDSEGSFFHIMGNPSDDPKAPINVSPYIMPLYQVDIPAYTYSHRDVKTKLIENKRYTMRDIGRLENRIENLEYYQTLSLLESQAAAASTKDSQGLDRFKNGFVVDDFAMYGTGDTNSNEFLSVIDKGRKQLRPRYSLANRKAVFNLSQSHNAIIRNGIAMLPYTHELADSQPYASRPLSINPYLIYRKKGQLVMTPNVDSWSDTERAPDIQVDIDTGVDAITQLTERQNSIVTAFNDWAFANSTIRAGGTIDTGLGSITNSTQIDRETSSTTNTTRTAASATRTAATTTTTRTTTETTTTSTDTRTETQASIESKTDTYSFDKVNDVSIIPYMRETQIEFVATGLMPNTRFYAFFDNQDVSSLTSIIGSTNKIGTALQAGMLLSDAKGTLSGVINIPAGRFFTGTRDLRITNDSGNTKSETLETSYAEAQFFAGGILQEKQEVNLAVTTPVWNEQDVVTTNTTVNRNVSNRTNTTTTGGNTIGISPGNRWSGRDGGGGGRDPVAQSFKPTMDCFVSKLELYFEAAQLGTEIWFEIRTMDNGYPTENTLGRVVKQASSLKTSYDASVATTIEFASPIRLKADTEYCFVVGGDSPDTRIWIAKLGENAVNVPNKVVDTQITLGSSFRSQNGSTWNAEQYEDIMYKLYVCRFTQNELTAKFDVSGGLEELPLDSAPLEGEKGINLVRVYTKNDHALVVGDKVRINLYPGASYSITLTNGNLVVGHELSIDNGLAKAVVTSVSYINATQLVATLDAIEGSINANSTFIASPFLKKAGNKDVIKAYYDQEVEDYDIRQAAGRFTGVNTASELNGFPVGDLNKIHQVKRVDDNKSFIIEMSQTATSSGRFGPSNARALMNVKADMLNIAGSYIIHDANESWVFNSIAHGERGSDFANRNYNAIGAKIFTPKADRYLDQPIKIASLLNENERLTGKPSLTFSGTFKSNNNYLSPMINVDTFSTTLISNNVVWIDSTVYNQAPNAGRFKPETDPSQGSEQFKYVTKQINLANPAADLRIWFDMYKPNNSDFDIYVKLMTSEVNNIDSLGWTKLTGFDKTPTSSAVDKFIEFDLMLSDIAPSMTGMDKMFGSFKFKIVGRSKNSAIPPVFKNLRLIAFT